MEETKRFPLHSLPSDTANNSELSKINLSSSHISVDKPLPKNIRFQVGHQQQLLQTKPHSRQRKANTLHPSRLRLSHYRSEQAPGRIAVTEDIFSIVQEETKEHSFLTPQNQRVGRNFNYTLHGEDTKFMTFGKDADAPPPLPEPCEEIKEEDHKARQP